PRQEGNADGGGAQNEQSGGQLRAAPPVALDCHPQCGAEGSGNEGERKDDEGVQHSRQLVGEREKYSRKDEYRGDTVSKEVEILRASPYHHANRDLPRSDLISVGAWVVTTEMGEGRVRMLYGVFHCIDSS